MLQLHGKSIIHFKVLLAPGIISAIKMFSGLNLTAHGRFKIIKSRTLIIIRTIHRYMLKPVIVQH